MGMMVEISRVKAEFATSYKTHFFSKAVSLNFIANLLFIGQHGYALPTRAPAPKVRSKEGGRGVPSLQNAKKLSMALRASGTARSRSFFNLRLLSAQAGLGSRGIIRLCISPFSVSFSPRSIRPLLHRLGPVSKPS